MSKYRRWYHQIVRRARARETTDRVERHHVHPRALGGSDAPTNIVSLTCREHFLVHWLLTKMFYGDARRKMLYALTQMTRVGKGPRIVSSWQYVVVKRAAAEKMRGPMPEATKIKMSRTIAKRNRVFTQEERDARSRRMMGNTIMRGRKASQATREAMSLSRMGNTNTLGYKQTPEHVAKRMRKRK